MSTHLDKYMLVCQQEREKMKYGMEDRHSFCFVQIWLGQINGELSTERSRQQQRSSTVRRQHSHTRWVRKHSERASSEKRDTTIALSLPYCKPTVMTLSLSQSSRRKPSSHLSLLHSSSLIFLQTSLVVPRSSICLAMQETWVRSPVQELRCHRQQSN